MRFVTLEWLCGRRLRRTRPTAGTPGAPVRALVPYVRQGALSLRSWVRPVHAESGEVKVSGRDITISGRLLGDARLTGDPVLLLRRRGKDEGELEFPGTREGADGFRCTVPVSAPAGIQAAAHDVWDLWLRYAADAAPARIGRILDESPSGIGFRSFGADLMRITATSLFGSVPTTSASNSRLS